MRRDLFEILATLNSTVIENHYEQLGEHFKMAKIKTRFNLETYKNLLYSAFKYGLIERKERQYPVFCNRTFLRLTPKGVKAVEHYEPLFYKGTMEAAEFLNDKNGADFIGG